MRHSGCKLKPQPLLFILPPPHPSPLSVPTFLFYFASTSFHRSWHLVRTFLFRLHILGFPDFNFLPRPIFSSSCVFLLPNRISLDYPTLHNSVSKVSMCSEVVVTGKCIQRSKQLFSHQPFLLSWILSVLGYSYSNHPMIIEHHSIYEHA